MIDDSPARDESAARPPAPVELVIGSFLPGEREEASVAVSPSRAESDPPLQRPFGVAFDAAGTLYLVELEGGRVFRRALDGALRQISGDGSRSYRGDGGPLGEATFNGMHNIAATRTGDLYISDSWNHVVRRVDARTGIIDTFAGKTNEPGFEGDGGPARDAMFNFIMCVTLAADEKTLFLADLKNLRIRAIDMETRVVRTVAGNGRRGVPANGAKATEAPLLDPRAVATDRKGSIYVLERGGHALRVIRPEGTIHTVAGTGEKGYQDGPALEARLAGPKHLAIGPRGEVYMADDENAAVRCFDPERRELRTILGRGHGDERISLANPHGVAVDRGWLYVVDSSHHRVLRMPLETTR